MKQLSNTAFFLALLMLGGVPSVFPQAAEDPRSERWVQFRNGEISLDFDQIPVYVALETIRARTGVDIVLPSAGEREFLNIRLTRLPLEPAVRFLLLHIGVKSFVLMYDGQGRPNRAIGLGTGSEISDNLARGSTGTSNSSETTALQLRAEERDRLLKELERWSELKPEERSRIEERLKAMPPSETREQLVKEYGQQVLGIVRDGGKP